MKEPTAIARYQKHSIILAFSEYYGTTADIYDRFKVKRSHYNCKTLIIEALNHLFFKDPRFIDWYFAISKEMKDRDGKVQKSDLVNVIEQLSLAIRDIGYDFIVHRYEEETKDTPQKLPAANTELQFTKTHDLIILTVSFICKCTIPIIGDYCSMNPKLDSEQVILDCFFKIYEVICPPEIDILVKLYKIVDSRIKQTRFPDSYMWKLLGLQSIMPVSKAVTFYNKLITDIIPKLRPCPVIAFLHVTMKRLIMFLFQSSFGITFKEIDLTHTVGDDSLTGAERLEFHVIQNSRRLLRSQDEKHTVNTAILIKGIIEAMTTSEYAPTIQELEYYKSFVMMNKIQIMLTTTFLSRFESRANPGSVSMLNLSEFTFGLVLFKKYLAAKGFPMLSAWITAGYFKNLPPTVRGNFERLTTTRLQGFLNANSKTIEKFHEKYIHGGQTLQSFLGSLGSHPFKLYPTYEEWQNGAQPYFVNKIPEEFLSEILNYLIFSAA